MVALVGEPGVGKSRLFWEFTHSHRDAGLAGPGERLGLLRQGDRLPAGDRSAQGLLPDRGRDDARRIREKVTGKLLTLDRALEPHAAGAPVAARRRRRRSAAGRRSTRRSAASAPWRPASGCCCARARCSRCCWCSRTCTGSTPRPRRCSTAWSRACPTARLLLLVNYRPEYQHTLGQQDLLHAAADRSACRRRARRSCSRALLGDDPGLRAAEAAADRARPRAIPFFLEESVRSARRDGRAGRASAAPTGWRRPLPSIAGPGHGAGHPGRAHRPAAARGQAPAPVGGGDRQGCALRAAAGDRGAARGRAARRAWPPAGRGVPVRDDACSPISNTPSSTRSLTRWPTAACSTSGGARCTRRIVEAIETLYPDRLAEHVERLAHHALRGELWDKAVTYLQQAGAKAAGAIRAAGRPWVLRAGTRGLGASAREPRQAEQAIDLRFDLRPAQQPRRVRAAVRVPPRGRASGRSARGSAADGSGLYLHGAISVAGRP